MIILKKQFVLVYNIDKIIVSLSENNSETFVGIGLYSAEFDTKEELYSYIEKERLEYESKS